MTTIAYDHKAKVIAYDSRFTRGNRIDTDNADKHIKCKNGWHWFLTGSAHSYQVFVDNFKEFECDEFDYEVSAIVVKDGKAYDAYQSENYFRMGELTNSDAIGSGSHFAIAAMDHGKSAVDAVKYAATKDNCTGGKIRRFKI